MTKHFYDLIIGLCCYKSVPQTLGLIRSAERIKGTILFYVTTVLQKDTDDLLNTTFDIGNDIKITQSSRDSRYFCQDWGFVDCLKHGVRSKFWGTMDDDTEFIGDGDLIEQLYDANEFGFSVMGFSSTSHPYGGYKGFGDIGKYKNLLFVDGHNMFSRFDDNLRFGLCDQVGVGNTSYVEVEYCNRLKFFTGKPILGQPERTFIHHAYRSDPVVNSYRVPFQNRDTTNGEKLYMEKYGIRITPGDVANFHWENVVDQMNQSDPRFRTRQFVYGGMQPDWNAIYDAYNMEFINVF